jgi:periplasmic divalent cation tolerance protein
MDAVFVYITAPSADEGRRIGRALIEERLAACVNILDGMTSIYRWQGAVHQASETVVVAKTRADRFDALARRVRELHSYECPCVVALPLTAGTSDYLEWIAAESAAIRGSEPIPG